jgi:WD40 repeat protein
MQKIDASEISEAQIACMAFAPDNKHFLFATDASIYVFNSDGKLHLTIFANHKHSDVISRAFFDQSGDKIVSSSSDRICCWNARTGQLENTRAYHGIELDDTYGDVFSSDGSLYLPMRNRDKSTLVLLKTEDDSVVQTFKQDCTYNNLDDIDIAFYKKHIVVMTGKRQMDFWNAATGVMERSLDNINVLIPGVLALKYEYENIVPADDHSPGVILLNLATGEKLVRLVTFRDEEWLCMTPDGYYNGSANAAAHINERRGGSVQQISAELQKKYFRPDIIKARLAAAVK